MSTVKNKMPISSILSLLNKKGVPILNTLDKIIVLLKEQGKKQIELCEYIGVKKNAFTSWKRGANSSYKKHIDKIAEFLGVSTDYLLGIKKENSPSSEENGLSDSQKEIIALFDSAPPELQAAALAVLKSAEARLQVPDDNRVN